MMRIFPRFGFLALAAFMGTVSLPSETGAASAPVEIDRVIAVVNDDVITMQELRDRVQQVIAQLRESDVQLPPRDVLERQLLERLIVEHAQMQRAKMMGLQADDAMVERAIERIREGNNLSEAQLKEALSADGISWPRFREQIRNEIILSQLREQEVESGIVVSDAEIDNFLASNPDALSGTELLLEHIMLRLPESPADADLEAASKKVDEIARRLDAGEAFSQLAAAFSDAPDALEGGQIGWRGIDRLPSLYADAAKKLKPGQISPVLRSAAGLHIIRLVDMRGGADAGPIEVEQTHVRHILLRTSEILSDRDAESRLLGLRERIVRGGEDFAELARTNSADLSSANGGDIGWVNPGDTVPDFEKAMNELAPMEISQPVKSPFGWHLIQVTERRMQDVSSERQRNIARAALRERKAEEAYEDWLRRLRDETYVEYRLEEE